MSSLFDVCIVTVFLIRFIRFQFIFTPTECGADKPDPKCTEYIMKTTKINDPSRILLVGDAEPDMATRKTFDL